MVPSGAVAAAPILPLRVGGEALTFHPGSAVGWGPARAPAPASCREVTHSCGPVESVDRGARGFFRGPMSFSAVLRYPAARIAALGVLACVLLTVRFSPNWASFYYGLRDARAHVSGIVPGAAVDKAVFSAFAARGYYVLEQSKDLNAQIDDANHKIVRWRLLMPALGRLLHLPGWLILGLAHLGCWVLVTVWVAMAYRQAGNEGRPARDALCLGVIAGAAAPFFTSMGLLGYYDSWLALGLLAVAFARPRSVVWLACLLAPWVDERFVIGLPLALCVRRIGDLEPAASRWIWLKQQALVPLALVTAYTVLRLKLGGAGGSQTMSQYLEQFVYSGGISLGERLLGVWEGLRFGWVLVVVALVGTWRSGGPGRSLEAGLLAAGVVLTGLVGLFTALDMSRSMVLLVPVVPLGWRLVTCAAWWNRYYAAPVLAGLALLLPARHVVGSHARRVDNFWSPASALVVSHNNLGLALIENPGREAEALAHFTKTLRIDPEYAEAHNNLALILAKLPGRQSEALAHYAEALRLKPDFAEVHNNTGLLLATMPGRKAEALTHFTGALRLNPGYAEAHNNLANLLGTMPGRQEEALGHYAETLRLKPDYAAAHYNRAILLEAMPGRQPEALVQYAEALRLKPDLPEAHNNLALLLAGLPGRRDEALAHYAEALRLKPDFAAAHNNVATVLAAIPGRQTEAIAHFAEAVRLLPLNPSVHFNLAGQLERFADRRAEAETHYRQAISLDPNFKAAREALERLSK